MSFSKICIDDKESEQLRRFVIDLNEIAIRLGTTLDDHGLELHDFDGKDTVGLGFEDEVLADNFIREVRDKLVYVRNHPDLNGQYKFSTWKTYIKSACLWDVFLTLGDSYSIQEDCQA